MIRIRTFSAAALISSAGAFGAVSYTVNGSNYTENFDSIATTTLSATIGLQFAIPGVPNWMTAKIAGTGATAMPFITDDGSSNSGGVRNNGIVANIDRALGTLASGSNTPAWGVEIVNNTGGTLTEFLLEFNQEQYRTSTSNVNVVAFGYGFSGGSATSANFLSDGSLLTAPLADIIGSAPVVTNGAIPPVSMARSLNLTGLNWLVGQSLFLRWSDSNEVGNDADLAIDDFDFSAVPAPGAGAILGLAGLLTMRRRRS